MDRRLLALVYASFIFYLSSQSSPPDPTPLLSVMLPKWLLTDKFYHVGLYAGFGFVLYFALKRFVKHPAMMSILLGTLYGVSDEIHQMFVPYRTPSLEDLMADVLGLLISQLMLYVFVERRSA